MFTKPQFFVRRHLLENKQKYSPEAAKQVTKQQQRLSLATKDSVPSIGCPDFLNYFSSALKLNEEVPSKPDELRLPSLEFTRKSRINQIDDDDHQNCRIEVDMSLMKKKSNSVTNFVVEPIQAPEEVESPVISIRPDLLTSTPVTS